MKLYVYRDNADTVFCVDHEVDWSYPVRYESVSAFLSSVNFRETKALYILGSANNAPLITALFKYRSDKEIKIGSPSVCKTKESRQDPEITLSKMQQVYGASSVGGWHTVTREDFTIYSLVSQVAGSSFGSVNDHARHLLEYHPAYKAVGFVPTASEAACCRLLARIVDPRWFVDYSRPDRLNRLLNYVGVGGYNQKAWDFDKKTAVSYNTSLAVEAWSGVPLTVLRNAEAGKYIPKDINENPKQFLWRTAMKGNTPGAGYQKATRKFILLLRAVWLNEIACIGRRLFVPEYFFSPQEAVAYKKFENEKNKQRTT